LFSKTTFRIIGVNGKITPRPPAAGYLVFYLHRAALPPYAFAGSERVVLSV